ncbi:MAG: HDOD domain-containing protein [Proteobacteria bacterium]|nr:HDOD domain-containing protein [Pseudomonadota bacterium]
MKDDQDISERLESGYSLQSLSPIAVKLIEMASDEKCTVKALATLIEKDPSLAVRLVRLANSAFFLTLNPISTLEQAVLRIGFDRLRIMALSLSLKDNFPMGEIGPMNYEKFWRYSLYQALSAKALSRRLGGCGPEEAFVAGLISEIGLLIFFDLFLKGRLKTGNLELYPIEPLIAWEQERYGVDHRQIGEMALRAWEFPETIIDCQRFYGHKAREDGAPPLTIVCEVAREFSALMCEEGTDFGGPFHIAEECLGLDHEVINDILITTLDQVDEVARTLKVEVNKERDLVDLMEKANSALGKLSERISMGGRPACRSGLPSFENLGHQNQGKDIVIHTLQAVAHEIRNPVLALGGFAKRLAATLEPHSEGQKYVKIILEETERLEQRLLEMTSDGERRE